MKNNKIIESLQKIEADEKARERMFDKITNRKTRVKYDHPITKWVPLMGGACLVLVVSLLMIPLINWDYFELHDPASSDYNGGYYSGGDNDERIYETPPAINGENGDNDVNGDGDNYIDAPPTSNTTTTTTTTLPTSTTTTPTANEPSASLPPKIINLPLDIVNNRSIPSLHGFTKEITQEGVLMEVEWGRDGFGNEIYDLEGLLIYIHFNGETMSLPVQGWTFDDINKNEIYEISIHYNGVLTKSNPAQATGLLHIGLYGRSTD